MPPPTPRTTPTLVAGLIDVQDGADLSVYIQTANEITTEVCGHSGYSDGYEGSRMELIERWLAAHFYTIFDNQLAAARAGTVSVSYQWKTDYGYRASMYGQQAMLIDTKGNLAKQENSVNVQRKIVLGILWMGTCRRYPVDYPYDLDVPTEP